MGLRWVVVVMADNEADARAIAADLENDPNYLSMAGDLLVTRVQQEQD